MYEVDNKFIIKIPLYFIQKFNMLYDENNLINVVVHANSTLIDKIDIMFTNIIYDGDKRRYLSLHKPCQYIHQFESGFGKRLFY